MDALLRCSRIVGIIHKAANISFGTSSISQCHYFTIVCLFSVCQIAEHNRFIELCNKNVDIFVVYDSGIFPEQKKKRTDWEHSLDIIAMLKPLIFTNHLHDTLQSIHFAFHGICNHHTFCSKNIKGKTIEMSNLW